MNSALICILIAFTVHNKCSIAADEDFRPTPIPLSDWKNGDKDKEAGTLQEALATDAPPVVAAVPAHYWEDALRHSVYLTLVRDKIDQLIAKSPALSDVQSEQQNSKEADDHDLWEKIKTAPFDRLNGEEPSSLGDIAIMAKGRLLEEKNGFRFTEDELKEKCNEEKCMESVKAYWSVKRVRQRDTETVPGKHHYELTFSVSSQTQKKPHRPYENPVRTFTVREGTPVERPQYRPQQFPPPLGPRPQRAIWVHKNIVPTKSSRPPQSQESGLDRLFSSLFSSEEETRDPPPKRYRYSHPTYPQHSKVGHVGHSEHHHHKQLLPYTYKPHSYKVVRPLGPPPVQQSQYHYNTDLEGTRHQNHYTPSQNEYKHVSSNIVKTTKPAVLPTPPSALPYTNITMNPDNVSNTIETTTKESEIITPFTSYSKPKPTKINYFYDHVRPPVYNAPPGVFATMDKKPFKPLPPLKFMHSQKPLKHKPPHDFRPSPQVLDVQFSDPDPLSDAFRPITMGYAGSNTTQSSEPVENDKGHHFRKTKPPKKHDKVKQQRTTTSSPEIITAYNQAINDIDWVNILGAFTKTTSMDYYTTNVTETTSTEPFTTDSLKTTEKPTTTSTEAAPSTTTTTSKPRRTRPPSTPTSEKQVKVKKHKRVTTTTTTSTTSTERPHPSRRPIHDLTPQASSSAMSSNNKSEANRSSNTNIENINVSTTPMSANISNPTTAATTTATVESSTTNVIPTTYRSTTTRQTTTPKQKPTINVQNSTTEVVPLPTASQAKDINRFRQSTLMIKGTSIKHDRWNSPNVNKTSPETGKLVQPLRSKSNLRRKGSNFHGYSSTRHIPKNEEKHRQNHVDVTNDDLKVLSISSTPETTINEALPLTAPSPKPTTKEHPVDYDKEEETISGTEDPVENESTDDSDAVEIEIDEEGNQDHNEYIFSTTTKDELKQFRPSEAVNEVVPKAITASTTEQNFGATSVNHGVKAKCKNKRQNSTATVVPQPDNNVIQKIAKPTIGTEDPISVKPIATTEKMSTADFFDEIFGFTMDQNETENKQKESKYVSNDEDLEEFLESINRKTNDTNEEDEYSDDEKSSERSPFNNDEENRFPRHIDNTYDDYEDRPLSLLELMDMQ